MTKTMKEIADAAERRWTQKGYSEKQKEVRREHRKFVIHANGETNTYINNEADLQRRIELDHFQDELNTQRELREVWDE